MKMQELRTLDEPDLQQRLRDLREELFNLRFQYATRQLTNHARMREVRHDIARINTLLRERGLQVAGV
jgi:large subunit ribosomal protein L29